MPTRTTLASCRHICFQYMYKNRWNVQVVAAVIFSNPEGAHPGTLFRRIRRTDSAGGDAWFVPHDICVASAYPWENPKDPRSFEEDADGCWHVAQEMHYVDSAPNDPHGRTAVQFTREYVKAAARGFENDPRNRHCRECGSRVDKHPGGFAQGT